jgi:hypothetical protein
MTDSSNNATDDSTVWPLIVIGGCGCIAVLTLICCLGLIAVSYWMRDGALVVVNDVENEKKLDPITRSQMQLERPFQASVDEDGFLAGLVLAELSLRVYGPPESANDESRKLGFESAKAIVDENLVAWACRRPGVTVIVFQGTTDDLSDWFTNAQIRRKVVPGGGMHRGFYNAYQRFKADIDREVAKYPANQVWITGHSLGGAEAIACAHDLAYVQNRSIAGVITFGQPRLLGPMLRRNLRQPLASKTLRFVHGQDIDLPPFSVPRVMRVLVV